MRIHGMPLLMHTGCALMCIHNLAFSKKPNWKKPNYITSDVLWCASKVHRIRMWGQKNSPSFAYRLQKDVTSKQHRRLCGCGIQGQKSLAGNCEEVDCSSPPRRANADVWTVSLDIVFVSFASTSYSESSSSVDRSTLSVALLMSCFLLVSNSDGFSLGI